jgi:cytochrome P450
MIRRIDAFLRELDSKVIDGEYVCDLGIRLKKLVFEIILESLFGEVAGRDFEELLKPMEFVNSFLTYRFNEWVPLSLKLPFPKYLRFQSARRAIDRVIQRYVDRKRQEIELGYPGSDLLTQMILSKDPETGSGMDSIQIRDEAVSILLAGFETTGNLLSWMIGNLGTHPAALERLQVEIDSCSGNHALRAETVLSLPHLSSVVEETLRLNPPVWAWTKRALEKDVLGDFEIKKGQILFLSPYLVHRDPSLWKDPNRFDPDRWTPELREATKGAYFPFGMGPRTCVGKHFALLEAKLILTHFLSRFDYRLLGSDPLKPEFKITLGLASPLKVALQRRSVRG